MLRSVPSMRRSESTYLEVHHIVHNDLGNTQHCAINRNWFCVRTWKSVGSDASQLLVQPTMGLNRAARLFANLLTESLAV